MKKKNAFTLIELIAVLVILAVIALIVTPLVMNVVKKAKISADRRSVDGYGKAIETAIAEYLVDTGKPPKKIKDLDIKYTGNEVICETRVLNKDKTVFLTGCSVNGREVKDDKTDDGYYHYGKLSSFEEYKVGDEVVYNGMEFYVIADSDQNQDYVTLLKAESLTVDELNTYGVGHVNMYVTKDTSASYYQTAYDQNGYGGMSYYSSTTCGYDETGTYSSTDCTNDYNKSDIKYVVDAWSTAKFAENALTKDSLGYKARLLTLEELATNLGYEFEDRATALYLSPETTPSWVYNSQYSYWTMSPYRDSNKEVWCIGNTGIVNGYGNYFVVVRPVVNLKKIAIE